MQGEEYSGMRKKVSVRRSTLVCALGKYEEVRLGSNVSPWTEYKALCWCV